MKVRAVLVALSALGLAVTGAVVAAAPAVATATWTSVAGTGVGDIPDGPSPCDVYGAPLTVSFTVAGMPVAPLSGVRIAGLEMSHAWVGDLDVVLAAPNAAQTTIFSRVGYAPGNPAGDSSNLGGTYSFSDTATPNNLWLEAASLSNAQTVPSGRYNATTPGNGPEPGGVSTSITNAFSSVSDPNGVWTLTIQDHCGGDLGSITAVSLQLQSSSGLGPCTGYGMELNSAQVAVNAAIASLALARTDERAAASAAGVAQGVKDAATEAVADATAATSAAATAVATAKAKVVTATKGLAKAKKSHSKRKIAKAAKTLKAAKADLAAKQKIATSAKARLTAATSKATTAAQTLVAKQAALDGAEIAVSAADAALATARDTLAEKKENYAFCLDA